MGFESFIIALLKLGFQQVIRHLKCPNLLEVFDLHLVNHGTVTP